MKKLLLILSLILIPQLCFSAPPTSTYTYTTGEKIQANEVQQNETNIYSYLSAGVDTYLDSSIVSADILDGTIVSADITDGTIVNADINSSAAIDASKITDGTVSNTEFQYINSLSSNVQTQFANILNGTTSFSGLTASANLDIGSYELQAQTFESDVATGTAPLIVASTTKVTNLNADTVDGIDSTNLGFSNVIFYWYGSDNAATNSFGLYEGTSQTPEMSVYSINYAILAVYNTTYRTILTGIFTKIAGISTITIHARMWAQTTSANNEAILSVDVGGQSNTVKS